MKRRCPLLTICLCFITATSLAFVDKKAATLSSTSPSWTLPSVSEMFSQQKTQEIPFYKTINSQFPSGFASLEALSEKQMNLTESEQRQGYTTSEEYYLSQRGQKISLQSVPFITALQLSRTWIDKRTRARVPADFRRPIVDILNQYQADPYDLGLVMTLQKIGFKKSPTQHADIWFEIPAETLFIPLKYDNGHVLIRYKNKTGFIDISDCMSKFDFAQFVITNDSVNSQWLPVQERHFDQLITTSSPQKISMNNIKGLIVNENRALIYRKNESLSVWSSLKIEREKLKTWTKSRLSGHGEVWWQKPKKTEMESSVIAIDDLLKKEVSSVSFHPKNPKKAIASAQGVYITQDGQNWVEIPHFKNYSGPVFYYNDSLIYVGNFRSLDGGKTFENYIQIEKLASAIEKQMGYQPRNLKVQKIKTARPDQLLVDIDIGPKVIRLKTPIYAQDWKIVKL